MTITVREHEPLAPRTTLEVGGTARFFAEPKGPEEVQAALAWARERGVHVCVIGGGSNLLVADRGVDGLVLRLRATGIHAVDEATVDVDAGASWDEVVRWAVERELAGLECLSAIPGDAGAAPIQNIGAYGQELSETLVRVEAVERTSGAAVLLDAAACELRYRDSVFKREAEGRYVITRVRLRLVPHGPPKIAYAELERELGVEPSLAEVRDTVTRLRRHKSMVLDPTDDNRRSAGSFFVNPTIAASELDGVRARAAERAPSEALPTYPAPDGRIKLSAAWLIERAGFTRGTTRGPVGISSRHSLALVNRGGASAQALVDFAVEVKRGVQHAFGVVLQPEPRLLGFLPHETEALLSGA